MDYLKKNLCNVKKTTAKSLKNTSKSVKNARFREKIGYFNFFKYFYRWYY